MASSTVTGVQIWDASTGQHLVSVPLHTPDEAADQAIWSPNSGLVAVMTNIRILIVNGETGNILQTISDTTAAINNTTAIAAFPVEKAALSSFSPHSSGLAYSILAWSPDSHFIAFFFGSSGLIHVWNPQSGTPVFNLPVDNSYDVGPLTWSPDGNYLTAQMRPIPVGGQPPQSNHKIVVWNVATRQVVFQHEDIALNTIFAWSSDSQYLAVGIFTEEGPDNFVKIQKIAIVVWNIAARQIVFQHTNTTGYASSELISWQPGSHNLAFSGNAPPHDLLRLEVWNITTGKLVKQIISDLGVQTWAWAPDGKFLAYSGYSDLRNTITILETATYQQVYAFNSHQNQVSVIVWSPNSKYIASGEGNTDRNMVAKVWIAQ